MIRRSRGAFYQVGDCSAIKPQFSGLSLPATSLTHLLSISRIQEKSLLLALGGLLCIIVASKVWSILSFPLSKGVGKIIDVRKSSIELRPSKPHEPN
jgi:hypothetical protein